MSDIDFLAQSLAWALITAGLVAYQLHIYLARPMDLNEDLDSYD